MANAVEIADCKGWERMDNNICTAKALPPRSRREDGKTNGKRSHRRCSPLVGHWKAAAKAGGMLSLLRAPQVTSTGYPAAAWALASLGNR